jgi:hypothetical protein
MPYKVADWQKERAKRFYRDDVQGRTNPWWLPQPGVDGWPLADGDGETVLTDGDGTILLVTSLMLVRFASPPTFTAAVPAAAGLDDDAALEVLP